MSMLRALSSMGSFAGGFMEGLDDNERRARRKKLEEQQSEVQALQLEGLKSQAQDQKDLRLATAPVVAEVNAPGDGMGPSANMVGAMGGPKTAYGTSPEQAQQATTMAEAMNTPEARTKRREEVLMRTNPTQAYGERRQAAEATLTEQGLADQQFARGAAQSLALGGWEGLTKHLSESRADGKDGAAKFGMVPTQPGKVRIAILGPDGKPTGRGMEFTDDEDGRMKALSTVVNATNPAARLAQYKWDQEFALKKDEGDAKNAYYRGVVANGAAKVDASQDVKIPEGVKLSVGGLDNQIQAITKQIEMAGPDSLPKLNEQLAGLGIQRRRLLSPYMGQQAEAGDPLGLNARPSPQAPSMGSAMSPAPAGRRSSQDADRANILNAELQRAQQTRDAAAPGSDEWVRADADMKSVARELGLKPSAAQARVAPKQAPAKPQSKPPEAAKPKPQGGTMASVSKWFSDVGADYSSPEGKKALQSRVGEAKKGGKPLTETETLRAKQAGLI